MMTYRDVPIIQSNKRFHTSTSGQSWFGDDKYGNQWHVYPDEGGQYLVFSNRKSGSNTMTRAVFDDLFTT